MVKFDERSQLLQKIQEMFFALICCGWSAAIAAPRSGNLSSVAAC